MQTIYIIIVLMPHDKAVFLVYLLFELLGAFRHVLYHVEEGFRRVDTLTHQVGLIGKQAQAAVEGKAYPGELITHHIMVSL